MIIRLRKIAMVKYGILKKLCVMTKIFMYYSCRTLWNIDIKRERFSILLIIYIKICKGSRKYSSFTSQKDLAHSNRNHKFHVLYNTRDIFVKGFYKCLITLLNRWKYRSLFLIPCTLCVFFLIPNDYLKPPLLILMSLLQQNEFTLLTQFQCRKILKYLEKLQNFICLRYNNLQRYFK